MVTAQFYFRNRGKIIGLKVEGHTGADEQGYDLVCCACSTLTLGYAQNARDMHSAGKLLKRPKIDLEDGLGLIEIKPVNKFYTEAIYRFDTVEKCFRLLAHNYPQYVRLIPYEESLA